MNSAVFVSKYFRMLAEQRIEVYATKFGFCYYVSRES